MTLSHDMYLELVNQLNKLNAAYYNDTPTTSDDNYDTLYAQIKSYENENPLLINPNSPTQTVGTKPEKVPPTPPSNKNAILIKCIYKCRY